MVPSTKTIYPFWIRDTYIRLAPFPLLTDISYEEESKDSETAAYDGRDDMDTLYLSGKNIFQYLAHNEYNDDLILSFVITSLRDLYYNNRKQLPQQEQILLTNLMHTTIPSFKDIFEYKSLTKYRDHYEFPLYQVMGYVTPYSVLHVPIRHFIDSVNMNAPIQCELDGTNIIIQLDYREYDLFDYERDELIRTL
jgi:hypothetical protein